MIEISNVKESRMCTSCYASNYDSDVKLTDKPIQDIYSIILTGDNSAHSQSFTLCKECLQELKKQIRLEVKE